MVIHDETVDELAPEPLPKLRVCGATTKYSLTQVPVLAISSKAVDIAIYPYVLHTMSTIS